MGAEGHRASQLLLNALTGGGRFALGAITALLVTPYALARLGDTRFGLWALAGAVLAVVRLLDLGLNRALTRDVASASGRGEAGRALPAMHSARFLALALAGLALASTWLILDWLVEGLFSISPALQAEARFVILGSVAVAGLETAFGPYQASLDGLGRMDLSNGVDGLVQRLLSPLGVVLVLGAGWGLQGLVWKNLAAALLAGLAYVHLLSKQAPVLTTGPPRLDRQATRELLTFGRHVQAVNLGSAMVDPIAKTLLSRSAGLEALAIYELAVRVTSQLGSAFMALANAIFPAAASLAAESDGLAASGKVARSNGQRDGLAASISRGRRTKGSRNTRQSSALSHLHRSATRYTAWLILPAWAILASIAGLFVQAWVGPDYAESARLIAILSTGWAFALLALPAFLVAQAGGAARLSTIGGLVTSGTSIGLSLLLVEPYGTRGVALAISIGLAAGGLVTLGLFAQRFGLGLRASLPVGWRIWLAAAAGAALARMLATSALPEAWLDGQAQGLLVVALVGLSGMLASAVILLVTGEVSPGERKHVKAWLRRQTAGFRR